MKTFIAILMLASFAMAAPDLTTARDAFGEIAKEAQAAQARAASMERLWNLELDRSIALKQQIETDKAAAQKRLEDLQRAKDAEIRELKDQRGKFPAWVNLGIGGLITLYAAFVMVTGEMRAGLRALAIGLLISSIGYGMLLLGFWYAIGGLAFSSLLVIGMLVWELRDSRKTKNANVEIIDGVNQAMKVGEIEMTPVLRAILDAAQSKTTKSLVDAVVKGKR